MFRGNLVIDIIVRNVYIIMYFYIYFMLTLKWHRYEPNKCSYRDCTARIYIGLNRHFMFTYKYKCNDQFLEMNYIIN